MALLKRTALCLAALLLASLAIAAAADVVAGVQGLDGADEDAGEQKTSIHLTTRSLNASSSL